MLDEREWAPIAELLMPGLAHVGPVTWPAGFEPARNLRARQEQACALYASMTGVPETEPGAIWHHRLSLLGPPCAKCGKPLRAPKAKHCAACGALRATP